jgi:signal peptidase II
MAGSRAAGLVPWLAIALLIVIADQATKTLIIGRFEQGEWVTVTSFFNLTRHHNPGAAFSFLAGASGWQRWFFTAIGIGAAVFIVWMLRQHGGQRLFASALTLILGGAIGNVVDRLIHGYVVDFLQFRFAFLERIFPGGYFPTFNIADSCITVGAILLIVDELLRVRRSRD